MEPETAPSAQIVGQEFVKQYYTMLNAAPDFLHRFYSHNSSFIHGSANGHTDEQQQAVMGQMEIHKKIMSLNFNNCHARIRQVDSQSSVGGSVVVQVIGELSNNGQPMRRFVQSFVLAPQSAKKYYVHIDIFRYQDDYPSANDSGCAEADEIYEEEEETGNTDEALQAENGVEAAVETDIADIKDHDKEPAADSGCDISEPTAVPSADSSSVVADSAVDEVKLAEGGVEDAVTVEGTSDVVSPKKDEVVEPEKPAETPAVEQPPAPPKPLTWAAMASRNAGGPVGQSADSSTTGRGQSAVVEPKTEPSASTTGMSQRSTRSIPATDDRQSNGRVMVNGGKDDSTPRRPPTAGQVYPDNQQVFVGNLPQYLTDQELIEFFEQYGNVLDFRINRKAGNQAGNNVGQKNFGFMAFDSPDTVQKVLEARPIYVKKYRLNIEEKKPKEELAAARRTPRYSTGGGNFVRSGDSARRGGYVRNDAQSNSSDEGRTY